MSVVATHEDFMPTIMIKGNPEVGIYAVRFHGRTDAEGLSTTLPATLAVTLAHRHVATLAVAHSVEHAVELPELNANPDRISHWIRNPAPIADRAAHPPSSDS